MLRYRGYAAILLVPLLSTCQKAPLGATWITLNALPIGFSLKGFLVLLHLKEHLSGRRTVAGLQASQQRSRAFLIARYRRTHLSVS